jgi:hypothetical protein
MEALDLTRERFDWANSLCVRDTRMAGLARDFEFVE